MSKSNPKTLTATGASSGNRRVDQGVQSRAKLVDAARALFERDGYARTSTEGLLAATGLTRGALYHHFADKKDLFRAVCEDVHGELTAAIADATRDIADPREQLVAGAMAWIAAASQPGPRQVLLIDAPAVLGDAEWQEMDGRHGFVELGEAVREILAPHRSLTPLEIDAAAAALNGAINALAQWLARQSGRQAKAAALAALRRACDSVLPPVAAR